MVLLPLLLACHQTDDLVGAAPYEPGPVCAYTGTDVAGGDDPGLGMTVAEHVDAIDDLVETTLKWDHTGETTPLTTGLGTAAAQWFEGELVDPETGEPWTGEVTDSGGEPCPPYLAVTGVLSLQTSDGRLDEALAVQARSDVGGVARIDTTFDYAALRGSGLPLGIEPSEWDSIVIDVAVNLSAGTSGGELAVTAERVTDEADESHGDDIARWPWDG